MTSNTHSAADAVTVGELMDRVRDATCIDLSFWDAMSGRYRIPAALATHPTAGDFRSNPYVRDLRIHGKRRWTGRDTGSGWDLQIEGEFDEQAFNNGKGQA